MGTNRNRVRIYSRATPQYGPPVVLPGEYLEQAGNYQVMARADEIASVAYNYPRTESETAFYTEEQLKAELDKAKLPYVELLNATGDSLKKSIEERENGSGVWKWSRP